ncbi:hypothetical protein PYCC9005_005151 [Savitreella phatthalungensis]
MSSLRRRKDQVGGLGGTQHVDRQAELAASDAWRDKSPLEKRRIARLEKRQRRREARTALFSKAFWGSPLRVAVLVVVVVVVAGVFYGLAVAQKHRVERAGRRH